MQNKTTPLQMHMPGMPTQTTARVPVVAHNLINGTEVVYNGSINGGPKQGASGVVREALGRRAVVDLGYSGIWHIPYHFLSLPLAA